MHRTYAKKYFSYSELHEEHNGSPVTLWIHFCGLLGLEKFAKPPKKVKNLQKKLQSAQKVPKECVLDYRGSFFMVLHEKLT